MRRSITTRKLEKVATTISRRFRCASEENSHRVPPIQDAPCMCFREALPACRFSVTSHRKSPTMRSLLNRQFLAVGVNPSRGMHSSSLASKLQTLTLSDADFHFDEQKPREKINYLRLQPEEKYTIKLNSVCRAEVLLDENDIIDAQALLYEVYIEEGGWKYADGNPTGKDLF